MSRPASPRGSADVARARAVDDVAARALCVGAALKPIVGDLELVCAGTGISRGQIRHLRWSHIPADHRRRCTSGCDARDDMVVQPASPRCWSSEAARSIDGPLSLPAADLDQHCQTASDLAACHHLSHGLARTDRGILARARGGRSTHRRSTLRSAEGRRAGTSTFGGIVRRGET
jgi:hypothetical protein